jgi:hypothetical protein
VIDPSGAVGADGASGPAIPAVGISDWARATGGVAIRGAIDEISEDAATDSAVFAIGAPTAGATAADAARNAAPSVPGAGTVCAGA